MRRVGRPSLSAALTLALAAALLAAVTAAPARAQTTYTVNSTEDHAKGGIYECPGVYCTLRAAFQEADALHADPTHEVTIVVPAGTYPLTIPGAATDASQGALDVRGALVLQGAGAATTIIDAGAPGFANRIIDASAGTGVIVRGVTLRGAAPAAAGDPAFDNGGAIRAAGSVPVTIEDSALSGNTAPNHGGAVGTRDGALTLTASVVTDNASAGGGGGLSSLNGTISLTSSLVQSNEAGGDGGGINSPGGAMSITRSAIVGNKATAGGGLKTMDAAVTVTDSTLSGNLASERGGGVSVGHEDGSVNLVRATVTGNESPVGAGVWSEGSIELTRSIVATNPGGAQCAVPASGTFTSNGNNLDGDGSCNLDPAPADLPSTDPLLGPLQDNGGPTPTHALPLGSPAVDVGGTAGCAATDQRGFPRPQPVGGACDIGAFELGYGTIAGNVATEQDDTRLAQVTVTLTPPGGGAPTQTTTAGDGTYSFAGLLEGVGYAVEVEPTEHEFAELAGLTVRPATTTTADLRPRARPARQVLRVFGANRFATAANLSAATFNAGVPVVFVATGTEFPDALAGGVAAALADAPVLLVTRDSIPAQTANELTRLQAGRIVILGGTGAVSDTVAAELQTFTNGSVTRIRGATRFGTAAAVSAATFAPGAPVAFVATGLDFPDALTGVAAAAVRGGPLLLATRDGVPQETRGELTRLQPGRIVILGGTGVVSEAVRTQLEGFTAGGVTRLSGPDRFGTASAISTDTFAGGSDIVYVATGGAFPDALAGGAVAGAIPAPVLLVAQNSIPATIRNELASLGARRVVILGGTAAVSTAVEDEIRQLVGA